MFRYTGWSFLREVLMIIASLFILVPFYFLIVTSLKTDQEAISSSPLAPPTSPNFENYITVLTTTGPNSIVLGLVNSVIITAGTILGLIFFGSLAGYVISRRFARWSRAAYFLFLIAIILPTQLGVVPLYVGLRTIGLTGSVWGMIIIYIGMFIPLAVFLYAGFFRGIPRDYEEAASIDGAGPFQVFWRVMLPMMRPITGTVAILCGLIVWNDFFNALIFLSGSQASTLPVSMYNYIGSLVSKWNLIFAIVVLSMLPMLILYAFLQRRFIQGMSGGLKA